jgi:hypothetical protein
MIAACTRDRSPSLVSTRDTRVYDVCLCDEQISRRPARRQSASQGPPTVAFAFASGQLGVGASPYRYASVCDPSRSPTNGSGGPMSGSRTAPAPVAWCGPHSSVAGAVHAHPWQDPLVERRPLRLTTLSRADEQASGPGTEDEPAGKPVAPSGAHRRPCRRPAVASTQ